MSGVCWVTGEVRYCQDHLYMSSQPVAAGRRRDTTTLLCEVHSARDKLVEGDSLALLFKSTFPCVARGVGGVACIYNSLTWFGFPLDSYL